MLREPSLERFLRRPLGWSNLSGNSSLFTSRLWYLSWWQVWGECCGLELQLHSFHVEHDRLAAIVPLYLHQVKKMGLALKQLQFIGNIYPSGITVLSEYTGLLVNPDYESQISDQLNQLLSELQWDEFVVPFTTSDSFIFRYLDANKHLFRFVDIQQEGEGVVVDVSGAFDDYLAVLGKNTRLKLYNRRQLLQKLGEVVVEYAAAGTIDEFLAQLNTLDVQRWGRECFGSQSLSFHKQVALEAAGRGELMLSRLRVSGEVVSVLYNIRFNGVEYNIQSAYREDFHPKISLGTLHLGYAIEAAFLADDIQSFDLLYGNGKKTAYKKHFKGKEVQFYTIRCGKTYKALLVYRFQAVYRGLKSNMRRFLKSIGSGKYE